MSDEKTPLSGPDLTKGTADSRALVARAIGSKRAVVLGASFIGLEVAPDPHGAHSPHIVRQELTCQHAPRALSGIEITLEAKLR